MRSVFAVWWWLHADYMAVSQVVLGVLALAAGVAAIVYAWKVAQRQFGIMDEQGRVVDSQLRLLRDQTTLLAEHRELLGRIETIEGDQRTVLQKQSQIAEQQYQILLDQMARRPDFEVEADGPYYEDEETTDFSIYIHATNVGRSPATEVTWVVALGGDVHRGQVNIEGPATAQGIRIDGKFYMEVGSTRSLQLFPKRRELLGRISVTGPIEPLEFHVLWRIRTLEGDYPREGYSRIDFRCSPDGQIAAVNGSQTVTSNRGSRRREPPVQA